MAPWVVKGKGASFKELGGGPNKFGTITQTGTDGGGDALRFLTTHLNHQIPHVFWEDGVNDIMTYDWAGSGAKFLPIDAGGF